MSCLRATSGRGAADSGPRASRLASRKCVVTVNFLPLFPVKGKSTPARDAGPKEHAPSATSHGGIDAPFRKAVDVMLNRAASSLTRGTCTCLHCRGSGALSCGQCKGGGVLSPAANVRAHAVRDALRGLKSVVGLSPRDVPYAGSEWMQTNRCPRCHGHGTLPCDYCSATGLRYPYLSKDDPRQCSGQPGGEADCPIE